MPHPTNGYRLNGKRVPGVTTIIGRFKDSGALMFWACRQGQENPNANTRDALYGKRDEAADAGTLAHDAVEAFIKGKDPHKVLRAVSGAISAQATNAFESFVKWWDSTSITIVGQELMLVHPELRFGGCPDAIGEIDGQLCLLDWKTSKGVYPDYLIQLAAYRELVENGVMCDESGEATGERTGMEISGGFHLCKFSKGEHCDFSHHYWDNLDEAWSLFKLYRQCYDLDKKVKGRC